MAAGIGMRVISICQWLVSPPYRRLWPELLLIVDARERFELFQRAHARFQASSPFWWRWVPLAIGVNFILVMRVVDWAVRKNVHGSVAEVLSFLMLLVILVPLASVPGWWLIRHRLRPFLAAELATRGFIVCARCGYHLKGLADPRCPECGTPFDPGLLTKL